MSELNITSCGMIDAGIEPMRMPFNLAMPKYVTALYLYDPHP